MEELKKSCTGHHHCCGIRADHSKEHPGYAGDSDVSISMRLLLPKYRGAAPIQQAVIDGEKESGVTIMQMGTGLDTGDMISRIVVPLVKDETGGSLF